MRLEKVDLDGNSLYEYSELKARLVGRSTREPSAASDRAEARRPDAPSDLYLLRDESGAAAAFGWVKTPVHDHTDEAQVWLAVEPRLRRFGLGAQMLDLLTQEVRSLGRTRLTSYCDYQEDRNDTGVRFAYRHGFEIAQRMGTWFADVADVAAHEAQADGYEIRVLVDTPDEALLDARAHLGERISREMPQGTVDRTQAWDAQRVRDWFASSAAAGDHYVEAVALTGAGEMVAFSSVIVYPDLVSQKDTYVASEHRGHGLGAALKAATARRVRELAPRVTDIRTFVDESNEPMNRVNRALGFRQTSSLFDLYKDLT